MTHEFNHHREGSVGNPHDGTPLGVTEHSLSAVLEPSRYGISVGELRLLVPQGVMSEVAERRPVYPIPHTAAWFEGVCNNRGDVVPAFNLHRLLGLDGDGHGTDPDLLLIVGEREFSVAIRIHDYPRSMRGGQPCAASSSPPAQIVDYIGQSYSFSDQSVWSDFRYRDLFMALRKRLAIHAA